MEPPTAAEPAAHDVSDRPRVVVSVTASADGRIALDRATVLLDPAAGRTWRALHPPGADELLAERQAWIESHHDPSATMEGSGTFVPESAGPAPELPAPDEDASTLRSNHLPDVRPRRWFVVVDGRGRVRWTEKGDDGTRLLVLVCTATPTPYLAYLRREQIPYLVAGRGPRIDLPLALTLIKAELGVACVVSEAGGGLNGALLRAGLVDELHLVLLPTLIGGRDTPATFDGPPLASAGSPTPLRLVAVRTSADGAVWLHHEVERGSR